jgi:hypothetical protein
VPAPGWGPAGLAGRGACHQAWLPPGAASAPGTVPPLVRLPPIALRETAGSNACPFRCASWMISTTWPGSSTIWSRSTSSGSILPSAAIVPRSQETSPDQYPLPTSTTGNRVILPVCTSVSASNSSSSVPKPPGSTTNACEYLTKTVLRTKK